MSSINALLVSPRVAERLDKLEGWASARGKCAFVLVLDRPTFDAALRGGAQPILASVGFSETDSRGRWRSRLGKLLLGWRWRRYLLNEGIDVVWAPVGRGFLPVLIGATLAGSRFKVGFPRG